MPKTMDAMKFSAPKIAQDGGTLSTKQLDSLEYVVLLVPCDANVVRGLPYGSFLGRRLRRAQHKLDSRSPFVVELPNKIGTRVAFAGIDPSWSAFDLLTLARKLIAAQNPGKIRRLAIATAGFNPSAAERAIEAILAAALAADFKLPSFKTKPDKTERLGEIRVFARGTKHDFTRTVAEAKGNNLARYLTALPPNELTPTSYRRRVEQLARAYRWRTRFLDMKRLKALGAGAFLAVAQGSPEPDAGVLHLRYTPRKTTRKKPVALVGKGICFDTGGTNLKPARHMHGMHEDMEGSAVALGTLLALTELKVDFPVDCWLALAQNHIGPKAYRQNEVVRAANGTTIEITHTDAEGRMVLADTLYFASREKPGLIVDYATLTGACVAALSTRMSGAFSNRETLIPTLLESGTRSGERVWPFPMPADYRDALKSEIADIKQCTLDNDADHILAAVFLQTFLADDPDWVHIDLAAGNHKGGLAHIPSDITGFGVRFTLDLLLERFGRGAGRS
jgi:leucyl aminopeptidase